MLGIYILKQFRQEQMITQYLLINPFYLASDFYYQKQIVCSYRKHLQTAVIRYCALPCCAADKRMEGFSRRRGEEG